MMFHRLDRPLFQSVEEYGRRFTDADLWRPYVTEACARHGLACTALRTGLPGTMPVFIVDDHYVVKFFSDFFGGDASFPIERDIYGLIARAGGIPAPALLAYGELFGTNGGWPWPYLITSVLAGQSLGASQLSSADYQAIADWLAPVTRRIHTLPVEYTATLRPSWAIFEQFIHGQVASAISNHREWQSLPPHLEAELASVVRQPIALPLDTPPMLIHADLNQDHVLGAERDGHWQPTGVIDFGDAKVGDLAYELVALHLGLFDCDKRLLRRFLDGYGVPVDERPALLQRAMTMTILHEFNVLGDLLRRFPNARSVPSFEALGRLIWDLDSPGLSSHDSGRPAI